MHVFINRCENCKQLFTVVFRGYVCQEPVENMAPAYLEAWQSLKHVLVFLCSVMSCRWSVWGKCTVQVWVCWPNIHVVYTLQVMNWTVDNRIVSPLKLADWSKWNWQQRGVHSDRCARCWSPAQNTDSKCIAMHDRIIAFSNMTFGYMLLS